ncbi:Endonuclease/exonuclease/phosphatase [Stachybotrys elegans]|uniref:Endonuclease/exonuclease/phosphatase n=1 Tax=Stachybotrys elegans TaxID=80388 RepID=A0A8K0SLM3_9HYPO|nr:Endonuclease/exonuclease/phosphatase [Stachybotrys elegans]
MPSTTQDRPEGDGPDGSSLKPVSSLLARFENMNKGQDAPQQPPSRNISPGPKPDKLRDFKSQEPSTPVPPLVRTHTGTQERGRPTIPATRPVINKPPVQSPMPTPGLPPDHDPIPRSPSTRPTPPIKSLNLSSKAPAVTVQPPQSPPRGKITNAPGGDQSPFLNPDSLAVDSPAASPKPFRIPARPLTPSQPVPSPRSPRLTSSQPPSPPPPRRSGELLREVKTPPPPPAPRNSKPRIPANKPLRADTTARDGPLVASSLQNSPVNADDEEPPQLPTRPRPQSFHPQTVRPNSHVETAFEPPPVHHAVANKRREREVEDQVFGKAQAAHFHTDERRPSMPVRTQTIGIPPPTRRMTGEVATAAPPRPAAAGVQSSEPPPVTGKRISSNPATTQMPPPPTRVHPRSKTIDRTSDRAPPEFRIAPVSTVSASTKPGLPPANPTGPQTTAKGAEQVTAYPDDSMINRRPPFIKKGCYEIQTKYEPRIFDVCGELVCTSGNLTRLWNIVDGELLMSLSHTEGVKATAIAFKPAADPANEGTKIWIGTNLGEILEVDVGTHTITPSKGIVHGRCEVVRMHRHFNELWTLDEMGNLLVWGPDKDYVPSLNNGPSQSFKAPKGHTFSLVVGDQLWYATGKELRILAPTPDASTPFQVLLRPLIVEGAGEITAGTQLSSQPNKVFLGHADGKVSVHSAEDFSCQTVINVSSWKINTLSGVGQHIWAGYTNGSICVYDVAEAPWTLKKEWRAHDNPVLKIAADNASAFRLDRCQVVSLGADNKIKPWDGLLEEDWLEDQMKDNDEKYCDFDQIRALIFTWNAGASTPHSLRYSGNDGTFFQDLVQSSGSPDILIFGFQELVDLEDKTATAKRFLKVKKKSEGTDQEKMSHQYRDWRDFLLKTLDDYMPADDLYHLLHTAPLVGLFTCVFVKASLRERIRNLQGVEIKRGMGGVYGNKGAVAIRFQVDDSSLCFVNCHLAAGQSQANARHNDANAILETSVFTAERDVGARMDNYTGGGDGSMILDHELCILNGDLNYRIDTMSRDTVVTAVKHNNLGKLLDRDQLLVARRRNPTLRLRAFEEMPIQFAPTYKYDVGTDNYDTSEKRRSPAWCDRVLYRGRGRIQQLDYRRHEVRVSDHRPVTGNFNIWVKKIDPKRRAVVWMESQQSFEDLRDRDLASEKLFYLTNVCGFDEATSRQLIKEKDSRKLHRSPSRAVNN